MNVAYDNGSTCFAHSFTIILVTTWFFIVSVIKYVPFACELKSISVAPNMFWVNIFLPIASLIVNIADSIPFMNMLPLLGLGYTATWSVSINSTEVKLQISIISFVLWQPIAFCSTIEFSEEAKCIQMLQILHSDNIGHDWMNK